uniref:5-hydroxytryptamine receptor 2B n=2 Tax=Zeugodacus cucurbitae TaxID=28588 RepID=A0A0A1WDI0_ZEUCU
MRISLPADLLTTAFETRMALHAHSINTVRSTTSLSNMINGNNNDLANGNNDRRHIVDILVGVVAVPVLILFALQLEKNLQNMTNSPWLVFVLGVGLLTVIMIIIGYVTHRLSVCCWTGPIDELGNRTDGRGIQHINTQNDILRIMDSLPPSYDTVVKHEIPPPPYDCVIVNMEQCKEQQAQQSVNTVATTSNSTTETGVKPTIATSAAVLHI